MANSVDPNQVQSDLDLHCLHVPFCLFGITCNIGRGLNVQKLFYTKFYVSEKCCMFWAL